MIRILGLMAGAMLVLSAAPSQRAEALSLINAGAAPTAKAASGGLMIEVAGRGAVAGFQGGGGSGFHGGGGGGFHGGSGFQVGGSFHSGAATFHGGRGPVFHGGGFRTGGAVFHGGGFRTSPVFHGGAYRYSGLRYGGYRFARHHHFHRRFFYGASYYPYYDYPYYYSNRRCRVIWTYYGHAASVTSATGATTTTGAITITGITASIGERRVSGCVESRTKMNQALDGAPEFYLGGKKCCRPNPNS